MSELDELQKLALISKVCTELDNHLGLSDRTLAEFITHLARQHPEPVAFREALADNGAEFPAALCDNLLRIIKLMGGAGSGGSKAGGAAAEGTPVVTCCLSAHTAPVGLLASSCVLTVCPWSIPNFVLLY